MCNVFFVPETWAVGTATTRFQLTVKQRFRCPLVAHAYHVSSPAQLRVDEKRDYACESTLLWDVGVGDVILTT